MDIRGEMRGACVSSGAPAHWASQLTTMAATTSLSSAPRHTAGACLVVPSPLPSQGQSRHSGSQKKSPPPAFMQGTGWRFPQLEVGNRCLSHHAGLEPRGWGGVLSFKKGRAHSEREGGVPRHDGAGTRPTGGGSFTASKRCACRVINASGGHS